MTTDLEIRRDTRPAVIDGETVVTTDQPRPAVSATHVRASALVLAGTLIAAGIGVHRQPDGLNAAVAAIVAAIALFLGCLWVREYRSVGRK